MNQQTAMSTVSLAGAAFSTLTTVYYWLVRVRAERPRLTCDLVDRELFLGAQTAETRQIGLKIGLAVANGSSLPNAVLGARMWARPREGEWFEVEKVSFDKTTSRPINVPAMQTAFLALSGCLTFPYANELEQGAGKTLTGYLNRFLGCPREIKVELKGLNDRRFVSIAALDGSS